MNGFASGVVRASRTVVPLLALAPAPAPVAQAPRRLRRLGPAGGTGRAATRRAVIDVEALDPAAVPDLAEGAAGAPAGVTLLPPAPAGARPRPLRLRRRRLAPSRAGRAIKRGSDVVLASAGLLAAAPLSAVIALAIRVESRGPILFRQTRVGRGGRPFTMLKFRTMVADADALRGTLLEHSRDPDWLDLDRDPRVTRVGALLRTTSLDEVPQLWNVLTGSMTLVGPRPLIPCEHERLPAWARVRNEMPPGVTGLWQVLGRTAIPFRGMLLLDRLYVDHWSLRTDAEILLRTVPAVLSRRGAN